MVRSSSAVLSISQFAPICNFPRVDHFQPVPFIALFTSIHQGCYSSIFTQVFHVQALLENLRERQLFKRKDTQHDEVLLPLNRQIASDSLIDLRTMPSIADSLPTDILRGVFQLVQEHYRPKFRYDNKPTDRHEAGHVPFFSEPFMPSREAEWRVLGRIRLVSRHWKA